MMHPRQSFFRYSILNIAIIGIPRKALDWLGWNFCMALTKDCVSQGLGLVFRCFVSVNQSKSDLPLEKGKMYDYFADFSNRLDSFGAGCSKRQAFGHSTKCD